MFLSFRVCAGVCFSRCYTYMVLPLRSFAKIASFCVVGLLAGCAADTDEAGDEGSSEEDITSSTITLGGSAGAFSVKDSPRLKSRMRSDFECKERFDIDGRSRLTCARSSENLEVIVRKDDGEAILVYRKDGAGPPPEGGVSNSDRRQFFKCSISGTGPEGLPSKLSCANAAPSSGGGGGGLSSPFASTVDGIEIPNTHLVGTSGKLYRGMAPRSDAEYDQLIAAGIGAVLVFKNQTGNGTDVADEITKLGTLGIASTRAKNIPFAWKDLPNYQDPCTQTVEALKFIKTNLSAGKKTFFHCTVGEDRTGMLAAMHRLLTERTLDAGAAWDGEMCERGYGAGNPLKPGFVKGKLEDGLKPLYRKLAYLAKKGALDSLNTSVCANDPSTEADFEEKALPLDRLKCGTSTMFDPSSE